MDNSMETRINTIRNLAVVAIESIDDFETHRGSRSNRLRPARVSLVHLLGEFERLVNSLPAEARS